MNIAYCLKSRSIFFFIVILFLKYLEHFRYMTDALPLLKGSPEALEASMLLILKRVDKMFEKLVNKPDLMVRLPLTVDHIRDLKIPRSVRRLRVN